MLKREYDIFKYQNNSTSLMISFFEPYYHTLCEFFDTEVHNFYPHIQKELEAVVTGRKAKSDFGGNMLNIDIGKEETEVYYQMDDESLGDPCFIPTNDHEKEEYLDLVQKLEEFDYSLATYFRQLID